MWLILNSPEPRDFVVATGEQHSLREYIELVFQRHGLEWSKYVVYDKDLERPLDIQGNIGDSSLIKSQLGWYPTVDFHGMVRRLVEEQLY